MATKIIALGHRQRTGKDALAGFIATHIKLNCRRSNIVVAGFADELKDTCHRLYGWAGVKRKEYYELNGEARNDVLPALNKTVRELWISFGNHVRGFYGNTWLNALLNRGDIDVLIIKDLRFENEFWGVQERGGKCIRVDRDDVPKFEDGADNQLHLRDEQWSQIVKNNGSLKDLNDHAQRIVDEYQLMAGL